MKSGIFVNPKVGASEEGDADTYGLRYPPAAQRPQKIDTGAGHVGFGVVDD